MSNADERPRAGCTREPLLNLVEICWQMRGRTGKVIECGIYETNAGVEVRVGRSPDDLLYVQPFVRLGGARRHADKLRADMLAMGAFDELPLQSE